MTTSTAVALAAAPSHRAISVFSSEADFASAQRLCAALTSSNLVPVNYQGKDNMGNALIALDMANRMGIPPMMVMQNLDVIEGRPSWKSQFIIGALNSCGLFSPIRFRITDLGMQDAEKTEWTGPKGNREKRIIKAKVHNQECVAYAVEKATGEVLEGPKVSIAMAVAEGWYFRPGSKWLTMPDLMLRYRAGAFFGRLYAPHILNGMPSSDEVIDVDYEDLKVVSPAQPAEGTEEASAKPAGRARGVHAAMNAAKDADKPKPRGKAAAPTIEADKAAPGGKEALPEHDKETGELADSGDDVFGIDDEGEGDTGGDYTGGDDADDAYDPA